MATTHDDGDVGAGTKRKRTRTTKQRARDLMRCMAKVMARHPTKKWWTTAMPRASGLTMGVESQVGDDVEKKRSLEQKLHQLQEEADEQRKRARTKKIDARYKRIKFFERRKLERRRKQIEAERKERPDDVDLMQEMQRVVEDLEYVVHFPSGEKYVSVLVEGDEHVQRKRQELRELIRERRKEAEGRLERTTSDASASASETSEEERDEDDWDDANEVDKTSHPRDDASEHVEDDDFFLQESEEREESERSTSEGEDVVVTPSSESEPEEIRRHSRDPAPKQNQMDGSFRIKTMRNAKIVLPSKAKGPTRDLAPSKKRKVDDRKPTGMQQYAKANLSKGAGNRPVPRGKGAVGAKGKRKETDRPGKKMPLRTRAEGGRKRRKKKK